MAFTTEDEWLAAYDAAQRALIVAIDRGDLEWPVGNGKAVIGRVAREVATAVIRSAEDREHADPDISTVPGVTVEVVEGSGSNGRV